MLCTQRGGKTKDTREVERATRDKTETLRTGSRASNARRNGRDGNAEQATHEETGNETVGAEKRETGKRYIGRKRRADGARRNGKTVRTRRGRRADGARRKGKTVRTRRKRRADGARRNGKTECHEREVGHKRGGGKFKR